MANNICQKTLSVLGEIRLNEGVNPASLVTTLASLPSCTVGDDVLDGCVLHEVLTRDECERLIAAAEAGGFSFWDVNGVNDRSKSVRNADTVEFVDEELCRALWERLKPFVPDRVDIRQDQERYESDLEGSWQASGLNPHLLINRYRPGGHFSPHMDGSTVVDFNNRSLYTVLICLNDCPDGGATQLLHQEQGRATELDAEGSMVARADCVAHAEKPISGKGILYWHQVRIVVSGRAFTHLSTSNRRRHASSSKVLHAGEPVGAGCVKYNLRTDVMYGRDPPACTEPKDLEAFSLYQQVCCRPHEPISALTALLCSFRVPSNLAWQARELDAAGHPMEAVPLFKKAAKLSEGIARAYRLGGW